MYNLYKLINNIKRTSFKNKYVIELPFDMLSSPVYNSIINFIFDYVTDLVDKQINATETKVNIFSQFKDHIVIIKIDNINNMDALKYSIDRKANEIVQTYSDIEFK